MLLLGTSVVSELPRPDRAAPQAISWACSVDAPLLCIFSITVMELGVARKERCAPAQGAVLRAWLEDQVFHTFKSSVLAFDAAARICGRLQVPDPGRFRDCMMAATALAHSASLVTCKVRDFGGMERLRVVNPWDGEGL
jgi:predicted nucleic acid-binding protein